MHNKTKQSSSGRSRPPQDATATMACIASDLEDAMLYTCLSNEKDMELITDIAAEDDGSIVSDKPKRYIALSPHGSYATLDDSSSSDSDISLAPLTERRLRSKQSTKRSSHRSIQRPSSSDDDENDGECTTISAVSSVASLFFGKDGPCSLHLDEEAAPEQEATPGMEASSNSSSSTRISTSKATALRPRSANTLAVPQPSQLKKSSLKPTSTFASVKQPSPKNSNKVQFAKVNVRQYSVSISQNPSCSEGPPIELGWDFREPPPICLQEYEEERLPRRRRLHDLILSDSVRRKMLLQTYSPQEITEAIRHVETLKRQRVLTYMMLPASALDEAAEELYDYMSQVFNQTTVS